MTATTGLREPRTATRGAHRGMYRSGLRALARRLVQCLSNGPLDPPFSKGLGYDFTPDVAEALTAAQRVRADAVMDSSPARA